MSNNSLVFGKIKMSANPCFNSPFNSQSNNISVINFDMEVCERFESEPKRKRRSRKENSFYVSLDNINNLFFHNQSILKDVFLDIDDCECRNFKYELFDLFEDFFNHQKRKNNVKKVLRRFGFDLNKVVMEGFENGVRGDDVYLKFSYKRRKFHMMVCNPADDILSLLLLDDNGNDIHGYINLEENHREKRIILKEKNIIKNSLLKVEETQVKTKKRL